MINVMYWPTNQRIVISGHAEHKGEYSPVVCGAASALFYALLTTTNGFLKYKWVKGRFHLDEKGIGYCKIWPKKWFFKRTRVAMGMCVGGMMMLEEKHPRLVHVEIMNHWNHQEENFDDEKVLEEYAEGKVSYLKKYMEDYEKQITMGGSK